MSKSKERSEDEIKANVVKHVNTDHQDTLVLWLRHYCKLSSFSARNARMTTISLSSIGLSTNSSAAEMYRIPLDPPMKSWTEVRQRVTAMDKECRKALNQEDVSIKTFKPPQGFHLVIGVAALATFILLHRKDQLVPGDGPTVFNRLAKRLPALFAVFYKFQWVFYLMLVIHSGEAIYMDQSRLSKYNVPRGSLLWITWMVSTFIGGFGNFYRFDGLVAQSQAANKAKKH